jgi:hypothetical protein
MRTIETTTDAKRTNFEFTTFFSASEPVAVPVDELAVAVFEGVAVACAFTPPETKPVSVS